MSELLAFRSDLFFFSAASEQEPGLYDAQTDEGQYGGCFQEPETSPATLRLLVFYHDFI